MTPRLRILLVDDHPVVVQFLAEQLQKRHPNAIILRADTVERAKLVLSEAVDLAILDDELPDGFGTELVPVIQKFKPTPIIFYTGFTEYIRLKRILDQKPTAVVIKNEPSEVAVEAILGALQGKTYLSSEVSNFLQSNQKADYFQLSKAEVEIIPLLVQGNTVKAMSKRLFISEKGVEKRIAKLYEKFHVKDRANQEGIHPREALIFTMKELGLV